MKPRIFIPCMVSLLTAGVILAACTPLSPTPSTVPAARVIPTETAQAESIQEIPNQFVYFHDAPYTSYYAVINPTSSDPDGVPYPPKEWLLDNEGGALSVVFTHFTDRMAFLLPEQIEMIRYIQVWVSDLRGQDALHIYTGTEAERIEALWWTPDDRHLVIQFQDRSEAALIYHQETNNLEAWPYACDQIALSPRSLRLALWCSPTTEGVGYAVVEWGGEIWVSAVPPEETLVQNINVAWSADGHRLAFADDTDPDGNLYLTDESGQLVQTFPGAMQWRYEANRKKRLPWFPSISWSTNGERLLLYTPGTPGKPCLPDLNSWFKQGEPDPDPPCWHVYDMESRLVIWSLPDSFLSQAESEPENPAGHESNDFESVALSADGRFLALSGYGADIMDRGIWIVDLETHQIIWDFRAWVPFTMRWGPAFEAGLNDPWSR